MVWVSRECWVVFLVSKEWSCPGGRTFSIVVSKLGNREPTGPVVLLEVTVDAEVLFQGLVYTFGLTVCLWMITGGGSREAFQENGKNGRQNQYLSQR